MSCWFNLGWTLADTELLEYWRNNRGKFVAYVDETNWNYTGEQPQPFGIFYSPEPERKPKRKVSAKRKGFTQKERNLILSAKGKICAECDEVDERLLQIDHIDGNPVNDTLDNLQLLCYLCHKAKHARIKKVKTG